MMLDNLDHIETPEGSDLALRPAGVGVRILAFAVDFLIKLVVIFILSIVLGMIGGLGSGIALILFFLLQWFYPVYFEVWRDGRTPGKRRMQIRVVNDDGTPVTFAASLIRNLLRVVDFLPFLYVAGIVASVFSKKFQRLGDMAAGTLVVYEHRPMQAPNLDVSGQVPVPTDFTTDEQRALLTFAERSKMLSPERQQELANVLQPILPPGDPVGTIKRMANTMVGRS